MSSLSFYVFPRFMRLFPCLWSLLSYDISPLPLVSSLSDLVYSCDFLSSSCYVSLVYLLLLLLCSFLLSSFDFSFYP